MEPTATTIAMTLLDELVRQGMSDVVVAPGSRSAPLALAVAGRDDVRLHVRIDERSAGFLALGIARGSGRPAAVLCSSGTATANLHPAVLEGDAAGVPLLVLTADRPAELRDVGANQTTTQEGLYGGAVRWAHTVEATGADPGRYLRSVVARAVAEASGGGGGGGGVPGPVHLNIPLREPLLDADVDATATLPGRGADVFTAAGAGRGCAPSSDSRGSTPALSLRGAPTDSPVRAGVRGLVVAGDGAATDPSSDQRTLETAMALGWPVLAEPTSGLRTGRPAVRTGHWLAASTGFAEAHVPDVVVVIGRPVLSRPVAALVEATAASGGDVVVCDPGGRFWDPGRNATAFLPVGLASAASDALADPRPVPGWLASWEDADRTAGEVLDRHLEAAATASELRTARDLAAAMPDGAALVVGSSLAIRHLNEAMLVRPDLRVIGNRGLSGIDGFTSTAQGVALAHDGPTAALTGDLSIIHDMAGLVIGPEEPRVPLPIVVLSNDGGGIFDLLPYGTQVDRTTFRRLFTTPHGLPLEGLAITVGCGHTFVDELAELPRALEDGWSTPGITLVEVSTDTPTETARHQEVEEAVAAALAG